MGVLDEAIREHLDLKRRRGADPAEIERLEREAFGPVRRDLGLSSDVDEEGFDGAGDFEDPQGENGAFEELRQQPAPYVAEDEYEPIALADDNAAWHEPVPPAGDDAGVMREDPTFPEPDGDASDPASAHARRTLPCHWRRPRPAPRRGRRLRG